MPQTVMPYCCSAGTNSRYFSTMYWYISACCSNCSNEGVVVPTCTSSSDTFTSRPVAANLLNISARSEEHTSELQSRPHLVCRLLLEQKKDDVVVPARLTRL